MSTNDAKTVAHELAKIFVEQNESFKNKTPEECAKLFEKIHKEIKDSIIHSSTL